MYPYGIDCFRERRRKKYSYFNRSRCVEMWFYRIRIMLANNFKLRKWACASCIHQRDSHDMNCLECCPMQRALDDFYDCGPRRLMMDREDK